MALHKWALTGKPGGHAEPGGGCAWVRYQVGPGGLHLAGRDHGLVGYRVPKEWDSLTDDQRGMGSLAGFKRGSRDGFLAEYRASVCVVRDCYVCRGEVGQDEGRNVGTAGGSGDGE